LFAVKLANVRSSRSHVTTGRGGCKVNGLTAVEAQYAEMQDVHTFLWPLSHNRSTLDIGVLGYIGVV